MKRAPRGQEGAVWWGERRQVRRALYGEELRRVQRCYAMRRATTGQNSEGRCMKRRARTGEDGDVRSGGHRQVRRALYGGKGADLSGGR